MLQILNVTLPFFALVFCGYLAARLSWLPTGSVASLNVFVLYFALPCMLFRFVSKTQPQDILDISLLGTWLLAGILCLGGSILGFMYLSDEPQEEAAFAGLSIAWSNWGYMGFALIPPLLGPDSLKPILAGGLVDLLVITSIALGLAGSAGGAHLSEALKAALLRVIKNPLVVSVLLGLSLSISGQKLPFAIEQFTALLGQTAGPVALFAIGASLFHPKVKPWRMDVMVIVWGKLFIHPFLVAVIGVYLFHLPRSQIHALTLMAALPVAGTVFVLAERSGANAERLAAAILVSTFLAFFSFATLTWMMGIKIH